MGIYELLVEIVKNPDAPKFYRQLYEHYKSKGMDNESQAVLYLIETKFKKNDSNS